MTLGSEAVARNILEALKSHGRSFETLRELAKVTGYNGAHNRAFKDGLNYLIKRGVLKICQSGWKSEERGGRQHPKGVVLLMDLYEIDFPIIQEPHLSSTTKVPLEKPRKKSQKRLKQFLAKIKRCRKCKSTPVVEVTEKHITLCDKHWAYLATSNIEW